MTDLGNQLHGFAKQLWPMNRSITGDGVRKTLSAIKKYLPGLKIVEIPTGTRAFDWTVPQEWSVKKAWIIGPDGNKFCDFNQNNLHLVGYSEAVNAKFSLGELDNHLYSIESQPDAIPYITSYYAKRWGFCIRHNDRMKLKEGEYHAFIDAMHFDGSLTYGELVIPGRLKKEILISTYVCHPSMANNELSGPVVSTFIGDWLSQLEQPKYTYRLVFIPETIGSIVYLSKNIDVLKENVIGGFNLTCIGDDRAYSYLPSRKGDTRSDRIAQHVLACLDTNYVKYTWNDRGSDERQYCAPHVDLPIASIMRTKYGAYDEYHTSLDDLVNVVTPTGLNGGYLAVRKALEIFENDGLPNVNVLCEPQLSKRGLYPTLGTKGKNDKLKNMMNVISFCDGKHSILDISEKCNITFESAFDIVTILSRHNLVDLLDIEQAR